MKWILTREEEDAANDCAELRSRGLEAEIVPCIECVDRPWPLWRPARGVPVVFLTSRRAARRYLAQPERLELVAAMAPVTSAYLGEREVVAAIVAKGGAVPLAEAVVSAWEAQGHPQWHVRYPTSDVALQTKEQALAMQALGLVGPVQREVVYETRTPAGLGQRLADALLVPYGVSFHSSSAVAAFLAEAPARARIPTRVVCFGRSTLAEWNQRRKERWPTAELSTSIVDTIISL